MHIGDYNAIFKILGPAPDPSPIHSPVPQPATAHAYHHTINPANDDGRCLSTYNLFVRHVIERLDGINMKDRFREAASKWRALDKATKDTLKTHPALINKINV